MTENVQGRKGPPAKSYLDLVAWQKSMDLTREVYAASAGFPREEVYGLTAQLRRAAVSVACNIAEGQARVTRGEFIQFLGHARGSLMEAETLLRLAVSLRYMDSGRGTGLLSLADEVGRLINGLINSLRRSPTKGPIA